MYVEKYDISFNNSAIVKNIDRITNQIFKLLPSREEGGDWQSPLENLIVEIVGMNELFSDQALLLHLLCKLEGLVTLTDKDDFLIFRKNIFESLTLLAEFKKCL